MNRLSLFAIFLGSCVLLLSCKSKDSQHPIVGKWSSGVIETEWGKAETVIVFDEEAMAVKFIPESGDAMGTSAPYVVSSEYITSEAINGGLPMRYVLTENVLTLTDSSSQVSTLFRK